MPDNNIYGVDFIARCMAGEALDKAGQKSWTLVAGNNISIQSDEQEKTETISADVYDIAAGTNVEIVTDSQNMVKTINATVDPITVDDELSNSSENPVQNKVITGALRTKPTSVDTSGTPLNDQKIMALTRQQYNAIQNKDSNTYYMITDDPVPSPINVRTAYVDETSNIQNTTLDGMPAFKIPVPADFTALDVSFNFSGRATSGEWTIGCDNYVHTFKVLPTDTRIRSSQQITMIEGHTAIGNADLRMMGDVSAIRYYADYNSTNNTVTIAISVPFLTQADANSVVDNTTNAEWTTLTMNKIGYVAYGQDNVVISDAFTAGNGITINGTTISLTDAPAADVNAYVSNGDLTIQIEDENGVPMGTGATVTLPTELPASTSTDSGKVLTVDSNGDPEWSAAQSSTQVQADWTQSDNTAVDYIKNKPNLAAVATSGSYSDLSNTPTIPAAQVNADWNSSSGVAQILNKPNLATVATSGSYSDLSNTPDLSDMATQTWVGQQGFLTSADEVPAVGSSDDGKVLTADYTGGTGSYSWETPATPADMATQTWVGQQGYLTSADEVPTVGSTDDGKVLTATYSGGTGSYSWATPAAGGLQVETDGTNYWITVNGIRLYFASSAPTGTIPAGSLGIGW